ncbi:regucalcin-like [Actinia tenebrosa]|uniref:Regucalcin n=1 Tax=Actinia tenebrosa TaxID=6105 RepID=A0A6P8IXH6_ACTTE|nr:regucalcin-like [Actinia tenebrosa]
MTKPEISVVSECCTDLGEGPFWDNTIHRCLYVDILGKSIHLLDPTTGKDQKYQFEDTIGAAVMRKKGGSVLLTSGLKIIFLDLETQKQETVATVDGDKPHNRFNDGKCDPAGRFWSGTMGPEPRPVEVVPEQGTLYSFDKNHKVQSHFNKITISNGLAWSPDDKTFYFVDSFLGCVYAFDYDLASGSIDNKRVAIQIDPSHGVPDGITVDVDGMLWIAMYNGGKVARYNPTTGNVITTVNFPVTKTTSVCWAGPNYDELLVTSERKRLSPEEKKQQPLAGSIFKVKNLGTGGLPSIPYDG